ncbi:MAG: rod shape-determining protein MreC [Spirochaetes bacterium]|nr:rod shape-determining protein MreC [Spirochaetota bacterium]
MDFLIRNKAIILFIAFTIFCIISLSIQSTSFTLSVEGIGSLMLLPFQKAYNAVTEGTHLFWAGFTELKDIKAELEKTKARLREYEDLSEKTILDENERLRQLLNLQEHVPFEFIPCSIISKDPDNWFRTVLINRGSDDGIKENMPVISFYGGEKVVFGKVIEVRGSVSRIDPIIASKMNIGVMFLESRYVGLLSSYNYDPEYCLMNYIKKSAPVSPGDKVITSGQGGIFPKGILVGMVIKSFMNESATFQEAIVKPFIDYANVEEVYVIKKEIDSDIRQLLKVEE